MPLSALFHLPAREALAGALAGVFEGPYQLTLTLHADRGMGRPALDGQILLPRADHQGKITRALGCVVTTGSIGYPPRQFGLRECQRRPISGITPDHSGTQPERVASAGFAEPSPGFRARPALRIVRKED